MRIFDNPNINFLKWRWHALALSLLIIVGGLVSIAQRGLPLGVEFSGGTVLRIRFAQPTSEDRVRAALPQGGNAVVLRIGDPANNEMTVRLPVMEGVEQGANLDQHAAQVESALRAAGLGEFQIASKDVIGPTIGDDLRRKGVWATVASLGGILLYIWFRFRLTFAIGAIAATLHDVLVTLVMLAWFGYDLSLNVVAALLTITGYSVNDTIVIFDRVRETRRCPARSSRPAPPSWRSSRCTSSGAKCCAGCRSPCSLGSSRERIRRCSLRRPSRFC
jgi:preprotein translocase subunit SecF